MNLDNLEHRKTWAALAVVALLVAGCGDVPPPGPSRIDVDTPKLQEMKAAVGIEDCEAGPGGGSLPALTLPCLGGGTSVDLSSLTGPMVINLWASNCGPCREEMPALQEFHERYGDQVAVLGIDFLDLYPEAAISLAELTGATYPSVADPGGDLQDQDGLRLSGGLPQFILLDAEGEVAHQSAGGIVSVDEVVAMVEEHLDVQL
ncbi:MAG: TlpA disulfide reductase family protein [Nocardioides sp.]